MNYVTRVEILYNFPKGIDLGSMVKDTLLSITKNIQLLRLRGNDIIKKMYLFSDNKVLDS